MPGCTFILTLSGALKFRHPAWRICVLPLWCASFIKFDFILLSFRWFVKQRNNPIISGHTAETTDISSLVKPINPLPDNYFQDFITFNKIDKLSSFIYKLNITEGTQMAKKSVNILPGTQEYLTQMGNK